MDNIKKHFVPTGILVYGMLFFSCQTMLTSISSGITWKIVSSTIGFAVFFGFATLYTLKLYQKVFLQGNSS